MAGQCSPGFSTLIRSWATGDRGVVLPPTADAGVACGSTGLPPGTLPGSGYWVFLDWTPLWEWSDTPHSLGTLDRGGGKGREATGCVQRLADPGVKNHLLIPFLK